MDKIEVLVKAKELLSDPEKWYKGYFAVNKNGKNVSSISDKAYKWCMTGALSKVCPYDVDARHAAIDQLTFTLREGIPGFNDAPDTTHQDVMNAFDKAIIDALNNQK